GAGAAADALLLLPGTGGRPEVAQVHADSSSTTRTAYGTRATIPRIDGVSSCSTVARIFRRPRARSVFTWFGWSPIRLRTRVILSLLLGKGRLLRFLRGLAAQRVEVLEPPHPLERVDGRLQDVVRVVGADRLGQDVLDAGRLQHRPHRATRD